MSQQSPQGPYQPPQQPYVQGPQPPRPGKSSGRHAQERWRVRHKVLAIIAGAVVVLLAASIGAAAGHGKTTAKAAPAPTVTEIQHDPQPAVTMTATAPAVRVTVTPTANAQGEATQISADGVYVVGQDIPGGTWHTSGGQQCYEATLSGLDTAGNDIISNDNFTGPDTVSLDGAKAFDITGGCTWQQEG